MAKIRIQKQFGQIVPADEFAEELIKALPNNKVMELNYSFPRNAGNHRRFFAFLNVTYDMQDHFDNIHHYRKWLIMKSGHYQTIQAPNGYTIFDADSIAWDKMDEDRFREVFNDCINAFLSVFGGQITREALNEVVGF